MPIYDYGCQKCGHEFEREQRIVEDPIKKCPACGALKAKRLISKTSFVLKGGGWYNDLYASNGAKPKDGGDDSSKSDSGGETDSSKASKGEKKSDGGDAKKKTKGKKKSAA